jgi:hypothetical protein
VRTTYLVGPDGRTLPPSGVSSAISGMASPTPGAVLVALVIR